MRTVRLVPLTLIATALVLSGRQPSVAAAPKPTAPARHVSPGSPAAPADALALRDGSRPVRAWRTGPPTVDSLGRRLAPIRLLYAGRSEPIGAQIDHTALVQLDGQRGRHESTARAALAAVGARPIRPLMASIGLWLVEGAPDEDGLAVAERLSHPELATEGIEQAFPNLYVRRKALADPFVPDDPRFPGQWYFDRLGMTDAWGIERGDPSTSIVVVDTGCDLTHPDLAGKMDPGRDVAAEDDDPSADPQEAGSSHGTACAGIVAAETDNGEGIAGGCPECRLRCVRLLTDAPTPMSADVDAFQFALDVDAAVVSNSWGFVDAIPAPALLAAAIGNVFDNGRGGKGALVIFAAGNDDRELGDDELTGVRGVFNVGAINNFDEQTPFTNFGASLDVVAYTGTLTTDLVGSAGSDPSDYMTNFGGTSSACPVVAGIAGLLASAGTDHTAADLYAIMEQSARPAPYAVPDAQGHDPVFGYGIIDPVAALNAVVGTVGPEGPPDGGTGGSGATGGGSPATPPAGGDVDADAGCAIGASPRPGGAGAGAWLLALGAVLGLRRRATRNERPASRLRGRLLRP